jgi:uncharacterized protein YjiK
MRVLKSLRGIYGFRRGIQSANPVRRRRVCSEALERRELLSASLVISEVHPAGSGNGTYGVDWFEVTNTGAAAVDVTGWKMDDNSNAFASAAPLRGVGVIPAGKSAVFFDNTAATFTDADVTAAFSTAWFGTATPPAGFLAGAYAGAGVGLSATADAVNLFDAGGQRVTGVSFGLATAAATFDNTAGLGSATLPLPAVSTLSVAGVNGAFISANGAETGSPGRTITGVDLSTYVRVGRYDLPEPTRTPAPAGSLLAREASAVTYNWDTDTLFVVGDVNTSIVQVTKTGQLIDSMTLGAGEFDDTEALTYDGGGKFVLGEERERQVNLLTYAPGTTLTRADVQTVDLGTTAGNSGLEGISYDPASGGFLAIRESQPEGIFQTGIDFAAGTATNGSATAENSVNLFDPALAGLLDFADVFALSNVSTLNGYADSGHLLLLSQESGRIVNIDRSGNVGSSLTIVSDPGNPLDVPGQQHEGLTMDGHGYLYVVSENGGGDVDHPQLWVYAPASVPNRAPTALALNNPVNSITENSSTVTRVKVADVVITDDGIGTNTLSVSGPDAAFFEVDSNGLYIKAGTSLDYETKTSYAVTVVLDDPSVGGTPDATAAYTLAVTDLVNEDPVHPSLVISEVAPWSSGSPVGADWFEVTNNGDVAVNIAGWKVDDASDSFAAALPLNGIASIAPGESVIFVETADLAGKRAAFLSNWFGATPPAGLQVGSYTGGSVGLSTSGDAVNLFDALGIPQAGVTFGASPAGPLASFNNAAGLNNAAIAQLSVVGVNGAFAAANDANQIGSPGTVGRLFISEVAPWASGRPPVSADWFEVTNTTAHAVDITGWKVDDSSASFAAALPLLGISTIAPGESVIFIETTDLPGKTAAFLSTWFGTNPPAGLQIGSYSGGSVGLSTTADAVNLFNAGGTLKAGVTFGASSAAPSFATFDNAAALNNTAIAQLSAAGVNGAFAAVNDPNEIGSPGTIDNDPPAAGPDAVTTAEDTAVTFNVLSNDTDPDGDPLTIIGVTDASHGTLVDNGNGSFTYTSAENFNGSDGFTYTVSDGKGRSATATVVITVNAVNDAPVLTVPGAHVTPEDVAVNIAGISVADVDANEGTGTVSVSLSVGSGTLTVATAAAGGLTPAQVGGYGTRTVLLSGPVAAVNATLAAGVTYLGNLNFNGGDTLSVIADDLGNTGSSGARTASGTVLLHVLSPTEQVTGLRGLVGALSGQGIIGQGQANALLKKLENAQAAVAQGKTKLAYTNVQAFGNQVQSWVATGVLTPAQAGPLLTAADLLLQGLRAGGGF